MSINKGFKMGLREGNEFTNNMYVIIFSLLGFVAFEFLTMSFQVLSGNILINVLVGMIQLLAVVIVNLLFGKMGFGISIITNILQIGLFAYDYYHYARTTSAVLIAFAFCAILINITIQFFLDTIYARMFRVKNLYNQTRERLFMVTEENKRRHKVASDEPPKPEETKIIAKHSEDIERRNEMTSVTLNLDPLTTLPNRTRIVNYLEAWIDDCTSMMQSGGGVSKQKNYNIHLAYMVITNFDRLLHTLGHHKLDLFIQCVAHRLRDAASPSDLIGRVETGEFIIITKRDVTEEDFKSYISGLSEIVINSFTNSDIAIPISTATGVAIFPDDARFSGDLINCAEYAVINGASSSAGEKTTYTLFSSVNDDNHNLYATTSDKDRKDKIESLFVNAFSKKEFFITYQPQYNQKNKLIGFEAFIRWNSPELGIVRAADFMAIAEKTGLIYQLGQFSLESGIKFLSKLNTLNKDLKLTVNFSALELKFGNTPGVLADLISKYGVNPANVIVDIPEECLMASFDTAKPTLNYIASTGVTMTLDNFGRGYSSLNNIPLLPISTIKIDGFFTKNIHTDRSAQIITSSIINLMHEIDINVCATGVGSKEQYDKLSSYGCDFYQGALCGNALEENEALKLASSLEV